MAIAKKVVKKKVVKKTMKQFFLMKEEYTPARRYFLKDQTKLIFLAEQLGEVPIVAEYAIGDTATFKDKSGEVIKITTLEDGFEYILKLSKPAPEWKGALILKFVVKFDKQGMPMGYVTSPVWESV